MCEVEGQSPTELYKLHYNVSSPAQPSPAQSSPGSVTHSEGEKWSSGARNGHTAHWELTPGFCNVEG